jgi:hypothetical protein
LLGRTATWAQLSDFAYGRGALGSLLPWARSLNFGFFAKA